MRECVYVYTLCTHILYHDVRQLLHKSGGSNTKVAIAPRRSVQHVDISLHALCLEGGFFSDFAQVCACVSRKKGPHAAAAAPPGLHLVKLQGCKPCFISRFVIMNHRMTAERLCYFCFSDFPAQPRWIKKVLQVKP